MYLKGTATEGVGYAESSTTVDVRECEANELPAAAAILTLPSVIENGATQPAVTIYPENAYNKNSVNVSLTSSAPAVVSVLGNIVTAQKSGSATVTAKVTGLLGQTEAFEFSKRIEVSGDTPLTSNFTIETNPGSEIPGNTITAKVKIMFKELQGLLVKGVDTVISYATDIFEFVSAEKSSFSGASDAVIDETSGTISFALTQEPGSPSASPFAEGTYYDFGTMTFRVKEGTSVGSIGNIAVTEANYMLSDTNMYEASRGGSTITVVQPVTNITVTPQYGGDTSILVKATKQLVAAVTPDTAANKEVTWTSSDENTATVNEEGLVTAKEIQGSSANVTITATAKDGSGTTGTIELTVQRPPLTDITFKQASYELENDDATKDLYEEIAPIPDTALKPAKSEITWQSNNSNIAVDTNGTVSVVNGTIERQTATITARYTDPSMQQHEAAVTITTKPKYINLTLSLIKLEGRTSAGGNGNNKEPLDVRIYNAANNQKLWEGETETDTEGKAVLEIDIDAVTDGQNVKIWIKPRRYLAKTITTTADIQSDNSWTLTVTHTFKGGDAHNDNCINLTDYEEMQASIQRTTGMPGFNTYADFDASGRIDLLDYQMICRNYEQQGDDKPQPALTMLTNAANKHGTLLKTMSLMRTPTTTATAENALETAQDETTQQQEKAILTAVEKATGQTLHNDKVYEEENKPKQVTLPPNPLTGETPKTETNNTGSTSGGCNTGFGILALLFAAPLIFRKKR